MHVVKKSQKPNLISPASVSVCEYSWCSTVSAACPFLYDAVAESIEEFHQLVDLRLQLATFVSVAYPHAALAHLYNLDCADKSGRAHV